MRECREADTSMATAAALTHSSRLPRLNRREGWCWLDDRMFTQVMTEEMLAAGKRIRYRISLQTNLFPARDRIMGVVPADGPPQSGSTTIKVK